MRVKIEKEVYADEQPLRMIDENKNLVAVGFYVDVEKSVQPRVVMV
jgi:hypothetical protein